MGLPTDSPLGQSEGIEKKGVKVVLGKAASFLTYCSAIAHTL
jgi:hypothetical protein